MNFQKWYDKYEVDIEDLEYRWEACELTWNTCKHEIIEKLEIVLSHYDKYYHMPSKKDIIQLIKEKI